MPNHSTVFVALDVHQKSIVAAYAVGTGEVQDLGCIGTRQCDLDRLCERMQSKGSAVRFVYEAGPCGYAVYRYLTAKGFDCTVCAPSKVARQPGDRAKTDQRDARKLVRALRMNDLSAVHVPDTADEAFRDLVRLWGAARQDLAKAKQRLKSFLLFHDVRYVGKANWGEAHRRWLARFVFKEANSQLAFQEHLRAIDDRLAQCERLQALLQESATRWRFYPLIRAIQALRGVQFTVAVGLIAEIGELARFASAPQLMAWLGMTPSEYSTGERGRRGSITKCGHAHARRLLVEAAWDAQLRLCMRFRKLAARGKPHNVALVAVARELAGFIRDIARLSTAAPNAQS
ncbi:MAG: IS110 family transposase ISSso6 [Steroidobacteraceae bacterium]|nr:IS110 family transposase ISSso6 [Steroidobacteraceae bacterium]